MLTHEQRDEILRMAGEWARVARFYGAREDNALQLTAAFETFSDYLDSITVPEGWKLVPVEPTEEMIDVGCEIDARAEVQRRYAALYPDVPNPGVPAGEILKLRYAAMLAAAPQPGDSNE